MSADEPAWWYGARGQWVARLLTPVAAVYGTIAARRLVRPGWRAARPVICVGNLTAGGTGKTPVTTEIVRRLAGRGMPAAILTRGYGGRLAGPVWVDPAIHTAADVGDEPLMHARTAPTLVARRRDDGARAIAAERPDLAAIVMDDGLQNPALAKDLRLAVIDGVRGIGNGRVIPAGPLRAPLRRQLARVDAVIVNSGSGAPSAELMAVLLDRFTGPVLHARIAACDPDALANLGRVVAFAGIGHPQRFLALLARYGVAVAAHRFFPDHHPFAEGDARDLLALAEQNGASLVTTEKDHRRLDGAAGALAELRMRSRPVPIAVRFEPSASALLDAMIDAAMARRPGEPS